VFQWLQTRSLFPFLFIFTIHKQDLHIRKIVMDLRILKVNGSGIDIDIDTTFASTSTSNEDKQVIFNARPTAHFVCDRRSLLHQYFEYSSPLRLPHFC
jgi:hypothetical protein